MSATSEQIGLDGSPHGFAMTCGRCERKRPKPNIRPLALRAPSKAAFSNVLARSAGLPHPQVAVSYSNEVTSVRASSGLVTSAQPTPCSGRLPDQPLAHRKPTAVSTTADGMRIVTLCARRYGQGWARAGARDAVGAAGRASTQAGSAAPARPWWRPWRTRCRALSRRRPPLWR